MSLEQHKAREKEKARLLRKSAWWKNIVHQGEKCYYCQSSIQGEKVTMDHIVPISQGGKSTKGNVCPCCKDCNTKKRNMTAVEWLLAQANNHTDVPKMLDT